MQPRLKLLFGIVLLLVAYQLAGHITSIYSLPHRLVSVSQTSPVQLVDSGNANNAQPSSRNYWSRASQTLSSLLSYHHHHEPSTFRSTSSKSTPSSPPLLDIDYSPPHQPDSVVIATAVQSGEQSAAIELIKSIRDRFNSSLPLVLWDLGLTSSDLAELSAASSVKNGLACPSSWCRLRQFRFDLYPDHLSNRLDTRAYKPFAIGALLRQFGLVIWTDLGGPWPAGFSVGLKGLRPVLEAARAAGLQAWSFPPPTAAFTHPQTFELLEANPDDYLLHRMVSAAHLLLAASPFLHRRVLLPWSRCALQSACWLPAGSGRPALIGQCRFGDIRPYFRYNGCHLYDTSVLNVVLGRAYQFNTSAYTCSKKVFGYGPNDTDLSNHFSIPGVDFAQLERSALPDYAR